MHSSSTKTNLGILFELTLSTQFEFNAREFKRLGRSSNNFQNVVLFCLQVILTSTRRVFCIVLLLKGDFLSYALEDISSLWKFKWNSTFYDSFDLNPVSVPFCNHKKMYWRRTVENTIWYFSYKLFLIWQNVFLL